MTKKSASQKQALRKQQERAAMGNIFNIFLTGLAAECVLLLVYRFYVGGSIESLLLWDNILRVMVWLGLAAFAAGAGVAFLKKTDKKLRKIGILSGATGLFLSVSSWIAVTFFESGVIGLCVAVPVATVLGLVYFLYQRECFVNTTLLASALFTIWVCGKGMSGYWSTLVTVCAVIVLAALAALALATRKIQQNGGMFRALRVFSTDCNYNMIYIVCAVCAVVILAAMLLPSLSFYLTWALVIALFAELAYYTTKLM